MKLFCNCDVSEAVGEWETGHVGGDMWCYLLSAGPTEIGRSGWNSKTPKIWSFDREPLVRTQMDEQDWDTKVNLPLLANSTTTTTLPGDWQ